MSQKQYTQKQLSFAEAICKGKPCAGGRSFSIYVSGNEQVYFTLWFENPGVHGISPPTNEYMGNLSQNIVSAARKAREMCGNLAINLQADSNRKPRKQKTLHFGDYEHRDLQEVYELDRNYLWWLCCNYGNSRKYPGRKWIMDQLEGWRELLRKEFTEENAEKFENEAFLGNEGDFVEDVFTIYKVDTYEDQGATEENRYSHRIRMRDSKGNRVETYSSLLKWIVSREIEDDEIKPKVGDKVRMKVTVSRLIEKLGIKFTRVNRPRKTKML